MAQGKLKAKKRKSKKQKVKNAPDKTASKGKSSVSSVKPRIAPGGIVNQIQSANRATQETNNIRLTGDEAFSLENLEVATHSKQFVAASKFIIQFLRGFEAITLNSLPGESESDNLQRKRVWLTRLSAAITTLFTSNDWVLDDSNFYVFASYHDTLIKTYELSYFGTPTHVMDMINSLNFSNAEEKVKRLLLFYSLNSPPELAPLLMTDKRYGAPILLSMLSSQCVYSEQQEANRSILLQQLPDALSNVVFWDALFNSLSVLWMNCSYAVDERRHLVKQSINKILTSKFQSFIKNENKTKSVAGNRSHSQKPKLGLMIEVCRADHAMYRCYGPLLDSLRIFFDVTLYATKEAVDEKVIGLADRFEPVEDKLDAMPKLIDKIERESFDMIYYPSLGMGRWTIITANLRLAPVQCFTLGHPATSCCETIDFALTEKSSISDPLCFTEKVVCASGYPAFAPHPDQRKGLSLSTKSLKSMLPTKTPTLLDSKEVVKIAIVSKYMKINALMLVFCKALKEQATTNIEFHFFPSTKGFLLDFVVQQLQEDLPTAKVHPYKDYKEYMSLIEACDLRLCSFPFGGANTTIDCIELGIPFLAFDGPEAFSHVDVASIERFCPQLKDELAATDIDELLQKAVKLVDDKEYRNKLSKELQAIDLDKSAFKIESLSAEKQDIPANGKGVTAKTLLWAFENFEKVMDSDDQVFEAES